MVTLLVTRQVASFPGSLPNRLNPTQIVTCVKSAKLDLTVLFGGYVARTSSRVAVGHHRRLAEGDRTTPRFALVPRSHIHKLQLPTPGERKLATKVFAFRAVHDR